MLFKKICGMVLIGLLICGIKFFLVIFFLGIFINLKLKLDNFDFIFFVNVFVWM